eukprot:scaffold303173_cov31-Tisochrysis_lutea.AAC.1
MQASNFAGARPWQHQTSRVWHRPRGFRTEWWRRRPPPRHPRSRRRSGAAGSQIEAPASPCSLSTRTTSGKQT